MRVALIFTGARREHAEPTLRIKLIHGLRRRGRRDAEYGGEGEDE